MKPTPTPPGPNQESVWDYPRPPALEPVKETLKVVFNGQTIAQTSRGWRVLETSHPPVYYFPAEDVAGAYVRPAQGGSLCEWKGMASYVDVIVDGRRLERVGWKYDTPTPAFEPIAGAIAFYARDMDAVYVGDERARPQPGGFYGGWVTSKVVGPFKGEPGSWGW